MKKVILLLLGIVSNIYFSNAQWQQANGPYSGHIRCFAISGTNIFAGTSTST